MDFSKRELDVDLGLAWRVAGPLELRGSTYALDNLNRGTSLDRSSGYLDGTQVEARYYLDRTESYDVGRMNFVGVGYFPSQSMVGEDGEKFRPGFFGRGSFNYEVPAVRSSIYGDAQLIGEKVNRVRLLILDAGVATRPFAALTNLEFRAGDEVTSDVKVNTSQNLIYGAIRVGFSNR